MDIETQYKFDGESKVSEVSEFLRERHVGQGWSVDGEVLKVGGYRNGRLCLKFLEEV